MGGINQPHVGQMNISAAGAAGGEHTCSDRKKEPFPPHPKGKTSSVFPSGPANEVTMANEVTTANEVTMGQ